MLITFLAFLVTAVFIMLSRIIAVFIFVADRQYLHRDLLDPSVFYRVDLENIVFEDYLIAHVVLIRYLTQDIYDESTERFAVLRFEIDAKLLVEIVEIVGVMDTLSFQTNLLALNASVEAARAMQMTLVAEVATAYFELVALDHELGVVRRTVETREESVRQAKLRFEGGLTSETAYQQAKVELASASALIPDLELRIAQKENQISVLAGDYPSRVARSKMDMNVRMPDSLPVGLPSTLLQRRPDVRQAEQNLKAAMASAGMAYADRFPRLTISLTGGLENDALKGLINSPFSYAAGNLTAPLFAFGSKRAKYRAALAAYDQARLAYEQKVLEVFREVNDAVTAYRNMRRTAELKFNLKEAARQYVVLAKLQYINGVIRYIDVLDAQRKFFDAQVEESKAVRNEHLALVGLYKALGGGWQPSDAEKKG